MSRGDRQIGKESDFETERKTERWGEEMFCLQEVAGYAAHLYRTERSRGSI